MDATPNLSPAQSMQLSFGFPEGPSTHLPAKTAKPARKFAGKERSGRPARQCPAQPPQQAPGPNDASARPQGRLQPDATMQDLLALVAADPELADPKRRNLACSIREFVEYLGLDLHTAANFPVYRQYLRRFQPGAAGVGLRRWANIRSDVAFALERYRARRDTGRLKDLLPGWQMLRSAMPNDRFQRGLSRLMHWASRQSIVPGVVDDEVMARFHRHLIDETFEKKPDRNYRDTCKLWNDGVRLVPGWPQTRVAVQSFRQAVSLPRGEIPRAFWEDFERYRRCRLGQDVTNNRRYDAVARASTIEGRAKQLRRFASAMVRVGRPAQEIVSLDSLLEPPWFEKAIQAEHDRLGGPCPSLQELAATLLAIARNYLELPSARIEEIARIKRRLKCRARGFTAKNRERLRPFRDARNQAAFLHFSDRLLKRAPKATSPKKAALLVQTALMHEILLVAPMRMENLTTLHTGKNFRYSGPGRKGRVTIVIQGDDVKNGVDLEFELPLPTAELLRRYLDRYRPVLLTGEDAGWLFPGERPGLAKHQVSLSQQLCHALKRHTGLIVNPHLYRHVAAFFYLEARPGDYETVRRLLGHTSLQTTMMFYADLDRLMASRIYAEHILERRLGAAPAGKKPGSAKATKAPRARSRP